MALYETATRIRQDFENGRVPQERLAQVYATYHRVPDLISFLQKAHTLFPALNCGIASVWLKELLGTGTVVQGRYSGQDHTFLLVGETLVDITADQYGGPAVYVGPFVAPWSTKDA